MSKNLIVLTVLAVLGVGISGCSVTSPFRYSALTHDHKVDQPQISAENFPDDWVRAQDAGQFNEQWFRQFTSPQLDQRVQTALEKNFPLQSLSSQVEEARQAVVISGANRLPVLTTSLTASRRKTQTGNNTSTTGNVFNLGVDGEYQVDIWRQLSDAQRQSQLNFRAQQYAYQDARLALIANVARTWFSVAYAKQLSELFRQRVTNIVQNLEIIESGYERGLNSALDVYLTRSSVEQERARLAAQEQVVLEQGSALQLLLAEYPDGNVSTTSELPVMPDDIQPGLTTAMLTRRPDVQQAWTQLLAQDAAVAVAHKQRFPQLVISAALDDSATSLSNVLDGDALLWQVLGNVGQTLYAGGRLRAQEQQARERLYQAENTYLASVYQAFSEVENALSKHQSLRLQFDAVSNAEKNSNAAYELSFQQYQRGLVSYATVLEAQQRAFDADSNLLQLRFEWLINRINLYTALGGTGEQL